MKKFINIKIVLLLLLTSFIISCSSDDDSSNDNFDGSLQDIRDFVTPELYNIMVGLGLNVNTGNTPPFIEGGYFLDPSELFASNIETDIIGTIFASQTFFLQDQNLNDLTITYQGSGGGQSDLGEGSFISGSGDNFSIFLTLESVIQGFVAETVYVLSGTNTSEGFVDFQLAAFMLNNNGNQGGVFIENGKGRIFIDSDGLVTRQ